MFFFLCEISEIVFSLNVSSFKFWSLIFFPFAQGDIYTLLTLLIETWQPLSTAT